MRTGTTVCSRCPLSDARGFCLVDSLLSLTAPSRSRLRTASPRRARGSVSVRSPCSRFQELVTALRAEMGRRGRRPQAGGLHYKGLLFRCAVPSLLRSGFCLTAN